MGSPVGKAEIYARDGHEADDDCSGLRDMSPVGPLYSLQLGPAGSKESDRPSVDRLRGLGSCWRLLGCRAIPESVFGGLWVASATAPTSSPTCRNELGWWRLERAIAVLGLGLLFDRHPAGTTDESGVELVDVPGM